MSGEGWIDNVRTAAEGVDRAKRILDEEILRAREAGVVAERLLEPTGYRSRRSIYNALERARARRGGRA